MVWFYANVERFSTFYFIFRFHFGLTTEKDIVIIGKHHMQTHTHTHERVHVYCNISSNALSLPYIFQDLAKPNMCIENINMKTTSRIGMWR